MNDESQSSNSPGSDKPQHKSERKAQANRENAKKSTGPRTERGRRNSSFNAVTHGLLANRIPYTCDADAKKVKRFARMLQERYGSDDSLRNQLLIEFTVVDYWRLQRGLDPENVPIAEREGFQPGVGDLLLRYNQANRRSIMQNFDRLEEGHFRRSTDSLSDKPASEQLSHGECVDTASSPHKKPAKSVPQGEGKII